MVKGPTVKRDMIYIKKEKCRLAGNVHESQLPKKGGYRTFPLRRSAFRALLWNSSPYVLHTKRAFHDIAHQR